MRCCHNNKGSFGEQIEKLTNIAIPKLEALNNRNKKANCLFWRGSRYFYKDNYITARKDFEAAIADFDKTESAVWIANAYAGIRACDIAMRTGIAAHSVCGETLEYKDGKLLFISQPGFSSDTGLTRSISRYGSLFYYVSIINSVFFDENLKIGESVHYIEEWNKCNQELIMAAKNERVATVSGIFDDCIKTILKSSPAEQKDEYYHNSYTAEVWYAKNVGLVKVNFKAFDGREEHYELCEYKINGGSGFMPFEVGNLWRYKNVDLPDYYNQLIEREIISCGDNRAHMTSFCYIAIDESDIDAMKVDSETCIGLADIQYEKYEFDRTAEILGAVIRRNDNVNSTTFALTAIDNIKRVKEYHSKDYKNIFSGIWSNNIIKSEDAVKYSDLQLSICKPNETVHTSEQVALWRINAMRNLHASAGTLFNPKWADGFKETIKRDKVDVDITAENDGSVTVKGGTFDNCLKVTIEEKEFREQENAVVVFSIKTYWFAPKVGIIRQYYRLNNIDFTCELAEYNVIAARGEYMPVYIGNSWVYEQIGGDTDYIARNEYRVENGLSEKFFVTRQFELIFKGTDEEYKKKYSM